MTKAPNGTVDRVVASMRETGSANATAKALGLSRQTVYDCIKAAGFSVRDFKLSTALQAKFADTQEPVYLGPIRCGQKYHGLYGFVFGEKGAMIEFWHMSGSERPTRSVYPVRQVRAHHLQEDNPKGTLLRGPVKGKARV